MKFKEYIEESSFKDIRKKLVDDTMKLTGPGEYDKKKVKKLYSIDDPKKFVTAYKRLTGASKHDLPKKLLSYVNEAKVNKKQINYYLNKWNTKMKGSTIDTAKGWVKGIGELNPKEKEILIKQIIKREKL